MSGLDCRDTFTHQVRTRASGVNARVRRRFVGRARELQHCAPKLGQSICRTRHRIPYWRALVRTPRRRSSPCSQPSRPTSGMRSNPTIFPWSPRDGIHRRVERGGDAPVSIAGCGRGRRSVDPRISGGSCRPACPGRSGRALERRSGDRRDQGARSIPTDGSHARPRYGAHSLAAGRPVEQQSNAGNRVRGRPSRSGLDLVAGAGNPGDKRQYRNGNGRSRPRSS